MKIKLPDGRVVDNVPEGLTKGQVLMRLRNAGVVDQDTVAKWLGVRTQEVSREVRDFDDISPADRQLINIGRGFQDTLEGIKQIGFDLFSSDEEAQQFTRNADEERALFERGGVDDGTESMLNRMLGGVAATGGPVGLGVKAGLAVPAVAKLATQATATTAGRLGAAGAAGGASGGTAFVPEGESRLLQGAAGTGFGLAGGAIGEGVIRGLHKVLPLLQRGDQEAAFSAALDALPDEVPVNQRMQIARDVMEGLTPEQAIRRAEIETVIPGAVATRGRMTQDLDDLGFEDAQRRASGPVADTEQANRQAILDEADRLVGAQGGRLSDPVDVGENVTETINRGKERRMGRGSEVDRAFRAADARAAASGAEVDPQGLSNVLNDNIDAFSAQELAPVASVLLRNGILKRSKIDDSLFELAGDGRLTPQKANTLRRALRDVKAKGPTKAILGKVRDALDRDTVRGVGEDIFAEARAISKREFDLFDNRQKVLAIMEGVVKPDDIIRQMGNWDHRSATEVLNTLDRLNPQSARELRAGVLDSLMSKLRGANDRAGVPEITFRTFKNNLDRFGAKKLSTIYGKDETLAIKQFTNAVDMMTRTDRGVVNPGTASAIERLGKMAGNVASMFEKIPTIGLLIGARRAFRDANINDQVRRRAMAAVDAEIWKAQQLESQIARQSAGATVGAGAAVATSQREKSS